MQRRRTFLCGLVIVFCEIQQKTDEPKVVWHSAQSARLSPVLLARIEQVAALATNEVPKTADISVEEPEFRLPAEILRARVLEGAPQTICAGHCASPHTGPVCAFDATGTARTFATLCELEAFSCRESTYYAITSLGEC